jgi:Tol biopolymer transport system component
VFSPDGKYVYYTVPGSGVGQGSNLWRVNINTHQRQQITRFPVAMNVYELDRGGNKLAFQTLEGTTSPIYTMNLDGTHVTAVPHTARGQVPHLNAAGNELIFYPPYGTQGIKTVHTDGTHLRNLTPGESYLQPDWSHDGKLIAFVDDSQDLFVMRSNGTSLSEVGAFGAVLDPVWQP